MGQNEVEAWLPAPCSAGHRHRPCSLECEMTRHFQIKSGRRQHQPWPAGLCLDTHELPLATQGLRWASRPSDEESQGRMGTPGKGFKRLKKNLLVFCLIVKICARGRELGKWRTRRKKQARAVDPDSRFSFILQIKCPHGSCSAPGQPHPVPGCALGLPPLTPLPPKLAPFMF